MEVPLLSIFTDKETEVQSHVALMDKKNEQS